MNDANNNQTQPQPKQPTLRELTRPMLEAARAKNGGRLGSKRGQEPYDPRKFRRF